MNQTIFERRIKPLFLYIGFIASITFSIAYIVVIAVLITGLEMAPTIETFVGFLIANLVSGACIALSLMLQGHDFAKNLPENKKILEEYFKKKDVKLHSMKWYWFWGIMKVIFTRLLMVAAMTYIVIDICWQGNGQYTYFLMAFFNILMFLGFGSIGLVQMYDKFNNRYIPWILKQGKIKEKETEKCLSLETKNSSTSKNRSERISKTSNDSSRE